MVSFYFLTWSSSTTLLKKTSGITPSVTLLAATSLACLVISPNSMYHNFSDLTSMAHIPTFTMSKPKICCRNSRNLIIWVNFSHVMWSPDPLTRRKMSSFLHVIQRFYLWVRLNRINVFSSKEEITTWVNCWPEFKIMNSNRISLSRWRRKKIPN